MEGTVLVVIDDEKYFPVVITHEKGDFHFQTNGRWNECLQKEISGNKLTTIEDYHENIDSLKDMDFNYEIIFPYEPTEEQVRLWIRAFASDKEDEFLMEVLKKIEEFGVQLYKARK
jgi:hypothetical protein